MRERALLMGLLVACTFLVGHAMASEQKIKIAEHGYASMGPLAGDPGVGKDQVPVAAAFGNEQSRGYVRLKLPLLLDDVVRLELRMKEDDDPDAGHVAAESAIIVSCRLLSAFTSGQQEDEPPKEDCAAPISGTRNERGVWIFDLSAYARSWAEGATNHGVSLRFGSRRGSQTWRVVFDANASSAILVSESDAGSLGAGPDPLSQPPPSGGGSAFAPGGNGGGSAFAPVGSGGGAPPIPSGGSLGVAGPDLGAAGGLPQAPPVSAATPVPAGEPASESLAAGEEDAPFRLPLVTLVLAPTLAGLMGFALRSPRVVHLLDPRRAVAAKTAAVPANEERSKS